MQSVLTADHHEAVRNGLKQHLLDNGFVGNDEAAATADELLTRCADER